MPCRSAVNALLSCAILLAGCTSFTRPDPAPDEAARIAALLPADALLFGEQHDAPEHPRLQRRAVETLAARGALAALALEMAERGHGTAGLPREAGEEQVRAALRWQESAWPWARYGPVVMAAVRAGVPVLGANLPRDQMDAARQDASLEARLSAPALARQQDLIRDGHCRLLPEGQIPAMTRVQIARDLAMARTVAETWRPGQTVLLVAGSGHVRRDLGVPLHLPPGLQIRVLRALPEPPEGSAEAGAATLREGLAAGDLLWRTPALPQRDHCAELQQGLLARR